MSDATLKIGIETENTDGVIIDLSAIADAGEVAAASVKKSFRAATEDIAKSSATASSSFEAEFAKISKLMDSIGSPSTSGTSADLEKMRQEYALLSNAIKEYQLALSGSGASVSDLSNEYKRLGEAKAYLEGLASAGKKLSSSFQEVEYASAKSVAEVKAYFNALKEFDKPIEFKGASAVAASIGNLSDSFSKTEPRKILEFNRSVKGALDELKVISSFNDTSGIDKFTKDIEKLKFSFDRKGDFIDIKAGEEIAAYIREIRTSLESFEDFDGSKLEDSIDTLHFIFEKWANLREAHESILKGSIYDMNDSLPDRASLEETEAGYVRHFEQLKRLEDALNQHITLSEQAADATGTLADAQGSLSDSTAATETTWDKLADTLSGVGNLLDEAGDVVEDTDKKFDKFSQTISGIAMKAVDGMKTKLREFNASLEENKKETESWYKAFDWTFKRLASAFLIGAGTAGLKGLIVDAVSDFAEYESQMRMLEHQLIQTGRAVDFTKEALDEMAKSLEKSTLATAAQYREAQLIFMTYKNLDSSSLEAFLRIAADMTTIMGGDLATAAKQLGSALENPQKGMHFLTSAGMALTESQQKTLEGFIRMGQTANATAYMLEVLGDKMADVAQAKAAGLEGTINQLARAYKDLRITIGEESLPVVESYVKSLTAWIEVNERLIASRFDQYVGAVLKIMQLLQPAMSVIGNIMMSLIDIVTSLPTWMQATGVIGALVFGRTGFAILGYLTKLSVALFAISLTAGKAGALLGGSAFAAGTKTLTMMGVAAGALHKVLLVLMLKFAAITAVIVAGAVVIAKHTAATKAAAEANKAYAESMEKIKELESFGGNDKRLEDLRERKRLQERIYEGHLKRFQSGSIMSLHELGMSDYEEAFKFLERLRNDIKTIDREIAIHVKFIADSDPIHGISKIKADIERMKMEIVAAEKMFEIAKNLKIKGSGRDEVERDAERKLERLKQRLGFLEAELELKRAINSLDENDKPLWTEEDGKQLQAMQDALNQLILTSEQLRQLSEQKMMADFADWRDALPEDTDNAKLNQIIDLWNGLWDAIYGARAKRVADHNQAIQDRINAATLGAGELLKIERARAVEEAKINMASTALVHQLYDTLESNRQRDHKQGLAARLDTEKAAGDQFKLLAIEQAEAIKQAQKDGLDVEATRRFYEELIALRKQAFEQSGIDEYQSKIDSLTLDERALFEKEVEAAKKLYAGIQPVLVLIDQFAELQRQAFDKAAADKYAESIKDIETEYAELGKTILEVGLMRLAIWKDEKIGGLDETLEGYEELKDKIEAIYEARKGKLLEGVVDEIRELNVEFSAMGNLAQSAINDIIGSFTTLSGLMSEYTEKWKELNEERKNVETLEGGVGNEEAAFEARAALTEKERELTLNSVQAQAAAYSNLFGTVGKMMKEGSKEREAMHRIEMALAVISIAMEMKKAAAAAITAIAVQATGGPYIGFVLAAAMAALMASIGAFSGSASASVPSGMQGSPTTGTVMGDPEASSQSAQRSQELIEELNDLQYVELTGIHEQMKQLNKNITGLVTGLVRAFGSFGEADFSGLGIGEEQNAYVSMIAGIRKDTDLVAKLIGDNIFSQIMAIPTQILEGVVGWILGGKTKDKFYGAGLQIGKITFEEIAAGIDAGVTAYAVLVHEKSAPLGGIFGGGGVSYSEQHQPVDGDVTALVNKLYKGIYDEIMEFAEAFGVPTDMIKDYAIELQRLDLTGLSGDEIRQKVTEWWNTLMDGIVDDWFGYEAEEAGFENLIGKYQQIDEGLYETAGRLVLSVALVKGVIEMAGGSFEATGMAAVEMSQGILEAAGGIEEFTAGANAILDKMLTPLDKLEMQWTSFNTAWDKLEFDETLPATSAGFLELLNSIDLTTKEGQKLYGTLVAAAPALADFYKEIEKITGISGQSVGDALWESITQNQGGAEFIQGLEDKLREGVARAMVDAFAQSLYDAFLSPINAAITQVMTSLITSGVVTGASIQAATTEIMKALNLSISILKDPAILGLIAEIRAAVGTIAPASITAPSRQSYTSAPSQPAGQDRTAEILNKKLALELQIAELMNDQNAVQEITNQQREIELQALRDLNPELATLQAELYGLQDAARDAAEQLDFEAWQRGLMGITDLDHAMEQFGVTAEQLPGIVEWAANASLDEMKELSRTLGIPLENLKGIFVEAAGAIEGVNAAFRSFVDQWTGIDSSALGQLGLSDAELVAIGDYMATLKEGTPEYIAAMNALSGMGISVDELGNAALSARANIEAWNASMKSLEQQALSLTSDAFQKQQFQQEKDSLYAITDYLREIFDLQDMSNDQFMTAFVEAMATSSDAVIAAIVAATGMTKEAVEGFMSPMMNIWSRILKENTETAVAVKQTQNYSRQMVSYLRTMGDERQEASIIDLLNTMNGLTEVLTETQKLQIRDLQWNLRSADIRVPDYYQLGGTGRGLTYDGWRPGEGGLTFAMPFMPGLADFAGGEEGLRDFFANAFSRLGNQDGYGEWTGTGRDREFETTDKFEKWFQNVLNSWSERDDRFGRGGEGGIPGLGLNLEDMYRLGDLMKQIKEVGSFINTDGSFNKENFSEMYDILRDQSPEDLVALYGDNAAKYLQDMIGLWERFGEEGSDTINELIQQFADWQKRLRNDDPLDSFTFERFTQGNDGRRGLSMIEGMEGWVDWAKVTDINSFLDIAEEYGLSIEELMEIIDAANARLEAFANFQDKLNNVSILDSFDFGTLGMEGWVDWAKVVGIDEFETVRKQLGLSFEDFVAILDAADQRIREIESKRLALSAQLADLLGDETMAAEVLAQQRAIELDAMDKSLRPLQERVWALEDEAAAYDKMTAAGNAYLQALQRELAVLETDYNDAKSVYLGLLNEEMSELQSLDGTLRGVIDNIKAFREGLWTGSESPAAISTRYSLLESRLGRSASAAMAGDTDEMGKLVGLSGEYLGVSKQMQTDWRDYARDIARTSALLKEVEDNAEEQLSEAERQIKELQRIVDTVNGVEDKITDIAEARRLYEEAKTAFDKSWYRDEIERLEDLLDVNKDILALQAEFNTAYETWENSRTDFDAGWKNEQIDVLYKILEALKSSEVATSSTRFGESIEGHAWKEVTHTDGSGKLTWLNGGPINTMPAFAAGGIISGPLSGYSMPGAEFHGTEAIIPLNGHALPVLVNNDELIAEIRQLRQELNAANYQIAKNTNDTAKVLRRIDDGDAITVREAVA